MAYCTRADVLAHIPQVRQRINETSRPSNDEVDQFCEEASNQLDGAMAWRYTVPIDTTAFPGAGEVLKTWATIGAAYKAAHAQMQGRDAKHVENLRDDWVKILDRLSRKDFRLPGDPTTEGGGDSGSSYGPMRGHVPTEDDPEPYFTRDAGLTPGASLGRLQR